MGYADLKNKVSSGGYAKLKEKSSSFLKFSARQARAKKLAEVRSQYESKLQEAQTYADKANVYDEILKAAKSPVDFMLKEREMDTSRFAQPFRMESNISRGFNEEEIAGARGQSFYQKLKTKVKSTPSFVAETFADITDLAQAGISGGLKLAGKEDLAKRYDEKYGEQKSLNAIRDFGKPKTPEQELAFRELDVADLFVGGGLKELPKRADEIIKVLAKTKDEKLISKVVRDLTKGVFNKKTSDELLEKTNTKVVQTYEEIVGKATDASKLTDDISKAQSEDKSFDEFMETAIPKGENIFYHGTSASGAKNIDKVGFIKTKGGFNKGRGISVSSDVSVSDAFASGEVVGKSKGKEGSIFAVELKPNAKKIDAQEFLDIRNDLAKNMDLSWEEMTSSAKKMGYISAEQLSPAEITKLKFNKAGDDVYKLLEKQGVDMIDHSKRAYTVGAQQSESVILNPDAILSKTKLKTRSQLKQLWEGGKKTKGLAESVEAKAIKEDVAKTLGELPEYEVRGVKSKVNEAFDLVDKDKAKAIRIAMGEEKPPVGFIPEDFYVALVKKASSEGDAELLKMLATRSNLIDEATLMGQRIRTLGEIDPYSPVNKIKEVNKANSDRLGNIKKKVDKEVKDIKRKTKATVEDWSSFVNSIKC